MDVRAELIVLLMLQEGLRCCEVSSLQLGDIDMAERLMLVRGKGDADRREHLTRKSPPRRGGRRHAIVNA